MVERVRIKWRPSKRDRVYVIGDADRELGTVIEAGSEQSEIAWDAGHVGAIPNEWLVLTEP